MSNDVIVCLESGIGAADEVRRGLLDEGERIAGLLGGSVAALEAGPGGRALDSTARAIADYCGRTPARLILFAHTDFGGGLAPLVALRLGTAAVTDCFDVRVRDSSLYYARYVYGDQFEQEVSLARAPEVASLNAASLRARGNSGPAPVRAETVGMEAGAAEDAGRASEIIPPDFNTVDIRYAERILDIGAGCGRPETMDRVRELAALLRASIGATRPMVDAGFAPRSRMIGRTGKSVEPGLLLALGVSGSPHHTAGFRKSGTVLSVNSDDGAPICVESDAGFAGDLDRVLARLIDRIKQYRHAGGGGPL